MIPMRALGSSPETASTTDSSAILNYWCFECTRLKALSFRIRQSKGFMFLSTFGARTEYLRLVTARKRYCVAFREYNISEIW